MSKNFKSAGEFLGKYATKGGIFKDTRRALYGANKGNFAKKMPRTMKAATLMGLALPVATTQRTAKLGIKSIGWVLGQAASHPKAVTAMGLTSMAVGGAARGAYRAVRSAEPQRNYNEPQSPYIGPGYNIWAKQRGMSANNLGATGGLTLALRANRHR
jgi:hypothetical protein